MKIINISPSKMDSKRKKPEIFSFNQRSSHRDSVQYTERNLISVLDESKKIITWPSTQFDSVRLDPISQKFYLNSTICCMVALNHKQVVLGDTSGDVFIFDLQEN